MELTVELLKEKYPGSLEEAIKFAESFVPGCPPTPTKPRLSHTHTSEDAKQYAKDLQNYELLTEDYRETKRIWRENQNKVEQVIEDYLKDQSGLLTIVPEKSRDKVWNLAYEQGHSNGYMEVYNHLIELIDLF